MAMNTNQNPTTLFDLVGAVEAVIKASDPAKREALTETIEAYSVDYAEDFHWSIGAKAPTLLSTLMLGIIVASSPEGQSKPRGVIRLVVDRKPKGT